MKCLIIILALVISGTLYSQENLVPNGDFSDSLTTNFQAGGHYYLCEGWWLPHWGSSDYYHHESDLVYGPNVENSCCGMAYCNFGCPDWNFEEDCVGMICGQPGTDYRELIECELTEPLVAGVTYEISFRLLRADSCGWACNEINVGFSDTLIDIISQGGANNGALPIVGVYPPVTEVYEDQVNWVTRTTLYLATGGERYLLLGNFLESDQFELEHLNEGALFDFSAYYYVDDVELKESNYNSEWDQKYLNLSRTMVVNSACDFLRELTSLSIDHEMTFCLYDSFGRVVIDSLNSFQIGECDYGYLANGFYYYGINTKRSVFSGAIMVCSN